MRSILRAQHKRLSLLSSRSRGKELAPQAPRDTNREHLLAGYPHVRAFFLAANATNTFDFLPLHWQNQHQLLADALLIAVGHALVIFSRKQVWYLNVNPHH